MKTNKLVGIVVQLLAGSHDNMNTTINIPVNESGERQNVSGNAIVLQMTAVVKHFFYNNYLKSEMQSLQDGITRLVVTAEIQK